MDETILIAALEGLEAQKKRIEDQIEVVTKLYQNRVLGRTLSKAKVSAWMEGVASAKPHSKRTMSAAGRARIAAAQRLRWKRQRKAAGK